MGWTNNDLDELHCMAHHQDAQDAMLSLQPSSKHLWMMHLLVYL
jgi:hypothetical protein